MKMKWKQVLYSLVIGAGMIISTTACTESVNPRGPEIPDDELEDAYFSFQSGLEKAIGTRAVGTDQGTTNERKVSRIRMVLYDAATNIANYAYDYSGTGLHKDVNAQDFQGTYMLDPTSTDAPTGYNPSFEKFMPQAMKVKKKPYKLLVLINPTSDLIALTRASKEYINADPTGTALENTSNVSNSSVFYNETGTAAAGNDLTAFIGKANYSSNPDNFVMSNYQEYVEIGEAALKPTPADAYAAPVAVKVDRVVAQVSMKADYTSITSNSTGIVDDGWWRLDITNKTSYWMRHKAATLKGGVESATTDRGNLYATDPNFDKYSFERYLYHGQNPPSDLVPGTQSAIKNYFNYITKDDVNIALGSTYTYEYALENTMAADEQYEDVTTAAILKVTYLPKTTSLGTTLGTAGYFVWGTYVFTATELVAIRDYNPANNDPQYNTFLTLKDYLMTNKATLEDPVDGFGQDYGSPGNSSNQVLDLAYNHDGINYYRILIRHFGDDQEDAKMAYGRYGVVRNNQYRLTLNSIKGPGSIDIPDPKGEDDKDIVLGVSIEVLPWLVREQQVDID